MGENTKIEWCDMTWNPWIGCTKVSAGCKHCYAEAMMDKHYGRVQWGPQGKRIRTSAANWKNPLKWNRDAKAAGKRALVFCASLADVFEDKPDQPEMDDWRKELLQLIIDTPHLDWLLLTKRPENVNKILVRLTEFMDAHSVFIRLPNVWIGTSIENQEQADKRIPELLKIPATVRFLSMEPLLGPVSIETIDGALYDGGMPFPWQRLKNPGIGWVIVGGESGPDARPMNPDWARGIRDQCQAAGVPFFFKQWGEWLHFDQGAKTAKAGKYHQWGGPFNWSRLVGKHAAGRLLDGREWNEFPEVS